MSTTTRAGFLEFIQSLECVARSPNEAGEFLLAHFVTLTEPTVSIPMEMITMDRSGGAVSRKPGNIRLDWPRLFDTGPDILMAAAGGAAFGPFMRGMVGLYVWNKIWRAVEEPISEAEASVIEALWLFARETGKRTIPVDKAQRVVIAEREARGLSVITSEEFASSIARLSVLECVEVRDDKIWLREWVRKRT